ncbi:MAG: hypothetical protein BroJett025_00880 [Patescibacteria group bacterium]|nr:MAG: hypothetical protein BroJett025_00880 [Patescibacteria group bacterium]
MPGPGGAPGMGGMSPPGGEISEQLAKMMGSSAKSGPSSGGGSPGSGQMGAAQVAQAQQMLGQSGAIPGALEGSAAGKTPGTAGQTATPPTPPREVGTIQEEVKRGFSDIFTGIKEFFNINTWLGINPNTLDPQQQAQAKQLHSRYQQLDQEQQAVARQMFEEKMQRKRKQEEEEQRKKQMEAEKQAQSFEMPSSPQKGAVGPGGGKSKKQNVLTKLKQDRTTLNNTQGE